MVAIGLIRRFVLAILASFPVIHDQYLHRLPQAF
jgi:hypothetical protein